MKKHIYAILMLSVFLSCITSTMAFAQSKNEVSASMRDRHPALQNAKNNGYVGEAWTGLTGLVNSDAPADVQEMVGAENSDRRILFRIIAQETGTSIEEVARQNRIRMYRLAGENHFIQDQNRQWVMKKDTDL
jgi:uncharacterized protein